MSIFVNRHTKVITQGMTGDTGTFHTQAALDYGTQMVGGVTPGKAGEAVLFEEDPVPVFGSMVEASCPTTVYCIIPSGHRYEIMASSIATWM